MAHIHGDSGRFPQAQAIGNWHRGVTAIFAIVLVMGILLGVAWVSLLRHAWWISIFALIALWWLERHWFKAYDRYTRAERNERRRQLRGADAEAVVAHALSELPDSFHVYHGVTLDASRDLDHIVIGPSGMWVISTKNRRGYFKIEGKDHWLNGEPCSFSAEALRDAMALREILGPDLGRAHFFQGVVVLPFAFIDGDGSKCNAAVVGLDELLDLIHPDGKPRQPTTREEVDQLVHAVVNLTARRAAAMAASSQGWRHKLLP